MFKQRINFLPPSLPSSLIPFRSFAKVAEVKNYIFDDCHLSFGGSLLSPYSAAPNWRGNSDSNKYNLHDNSSEVDSNRLSLYGVLWEVIRRKSGRDRGKTNFLERKQENLPGSGPTRANRIWLPLDLKGKRVYQSSVLMDKQLAAKENFLIFIRTDRGNQILMKSN